MSQNQPVTPIRRCRFWRCLVVVLLLGSNEAVAQRTILRAGRLLDVRSGAVIRDARVMIQDGRIREIDTTTSAGPSDTTIDLSAYTVLPGLIDAHVHLAIGGPVRANALADLRAGFTTVVDLGARTIRLLRIRDSINAGLIPGPRVIAAGIWVGRKDGVCEFGGIGVDGGVGNFRSRVRENADAGADLIKACVTGWVADGYGNPDAYELPDTILAAIVDESRRHTRIVVAHAIGIGGVRAALRTGVRGLAHAAFVDSATAAVMKRQGVFMIPTLASLTSGDSSAQALALMDGVRRAHRAGVAIVFGTDGGVLPHGENAKEFVALTAAGMSPLDAIRAATIGAATALGIADSVGTLVPGMIADILAVEGDPLTDVAALQRVRFVMSRGRRVVP